MLHLPFLLHLLKFDLFLQIFEVFLPESKISFELGPIKEEILKDVLVNFVLFDVHFVCMSYGIEAKLNEDVEV